jgi:mRNA interferase RelE/StbE
MRVDLSKQAQKSLDRLNEPLLGRIIGGLTGLSNEPPDGDIKALQGHPGVFRLRVGNYRILYTVGDTCIDVFKIAPRGQAYKE